MTLAGRNVRGIRLVERLGAGGMGEVWLGRDERLDRTLAVKVIREERRLDERARTRFLREARMLSQVEQPNICRLYDYVEEDGEQFLLLELVEGESLARAAERRLPEARVLDLAIQIADALAAAHGMSIVHRDLKPENVMVTPAGSAKVLDFGLARTSPDATAVSGHPTPLPGADASAPGGRLASDGTQAGDLVGTLPYMSPEQARGELATAASDVFALGLLLQELLTGEPPYDRSLPPSQLLDKARWGDRRPVRLGNRDLATLLERMTELEMVRRPPASAVARELRRIRTAPARRRRRLAGATAIALLALLATSLALLSFRLRREVARANREATTAEAVTSFLVELFEASDPKQSDAGDVTARELLDRGVERIGQRLEEQPATRARLLGTLGEISTSLGLPERGTELLEQASALSAAEPSMPPEERLRLLIELSEAQLQQWRPEAMEATVREALALAQRVPQPDLGRASALHQLLVLRMRQSRLDEAESIGREALALRQEHLGPDAADTGSTMAMLALAVLDSGRYAEAEELLWRAHEIVRLHLPEEHPNSTRLLVNLASARKSLHRLDDAEAIMRRVLPLLERRLGADHPDVAVSWNDLGVILFEAKRYEEAEAAYRRALEVAERSLGAAHPFVGFFLGNLAEARSLGGHAEDALPLFRRALEVLGSSLGEEHAALADPLRALAVAELALGHDDEAETHLRLSIAVREKSQGPDHPELVPALELLGSLYAREGRTEEAQEALRRALTLLEASEGSDAARVRVLHERIVALGS